MPATIASPPLTARPLRCRSCGTERAAAPTAICEQCLGPLDPVYEPGRALPDRETIAGRAPSDRKSTRLNSSHLVISYAVFCLKKKKKKLIFLSYIKKKKKKK